jgi:hypothetical protein
MIAGPFLLPGSVPDRLNDIQESKKASLPVHISRVEFHLDFGQQESA